MKQTFKLMLIAWILCIPTSILAQDKFYYFTQGDCSGSETPYGNNTAIGKFFSRIKCPILMLTGDEDDHAPIQTVVDAYYMAPNSRLSVIPKAWHTCFLDNFPATWEAIKPFLQEDIKNLKGSKKVK